MKNVMVYGSGCKSCDATEDMITKTAARLGVEINVEKITDTRSIAMAGIISTPAISVDGKLVHSGGLPDATKLESWLGSTS